MVVVSHWVMFAECSRRTRWICKVEQCPDLQHLSQGRSTRSVTVFAAAAWVGRASDNLPNNYSLCRTDGYSVEPLWSLENSYTNMRYSIVKTSLFELFQYHFLTPSIAICTILCLEGVVSLSVVLFQSYIIYINCRLKITMSNKEWFITANMHIQL